MLLEQNYNMYLLENSLLQGGKYRIVRFISSGGFGNTYEGVHVLLKKRVAIKEFFVKDFCNRNEATFEVTVGITSKAALVKKLKTKFLEEAQSVSTLKHHHIVNVHDVFEENGTAYYVMDYIEGSSLNDMVKASGALYEEKALKYILQVADALKYVHARNRLHLDIKPANIMIDDEDNAILIDFGVSKQYDEEDGENTSTLLGRTPGYAPLEQMGNDVIRFYPSTDIYALGATLYKILTGITPPSATLLASGDELIPLPVSLSENVRNAVYQAMLTNKTKRPQTIDEFVEIIAKHADEDITIRNSSESDPIKVAIEEDCSNDKKNDHSQNLDSPKKSSKVIIVAFCIVAVVAICGLGIYLAYDNFLIDKDLKPKPSNVENDSLLIQSGVHVGDILRNRKEHVTGLTFHDVDGKDFTYTGEVSDGKPNGQGMGIYPYGNYTGEYKDGLRQGKGKFETKDGQNKYEGTFTNDKYDTGKITLSDGYYFEGKFKDGQPYTGKWYDKKGKLDAEIVNGK